MKVVAISTHGFSVFEGTIIACKAFINRSQDWASYCFLYDENGILIEAKEAAVHNPVKHDFLKA